MTRRDTRTEADRGDRHDRISLRLPHGYKVRLQRLADEDGYSVADWICSWIEMAESEIAELRQRPSKRSAG